MRKFRAIVTAVATAGMVIGTMGIAGAATSPSYETRADFIYRLDVQLGISPVNPATPNFSDVPASNPYYGYIEAAYQAGITNGFSNGTFGPNLPLTRAEAAKYEVIAYGAGAQAVQITSTSFLDNAQIPTALVGYVGEANKLGLLKGFPNGNFYPMQNLTVPQEGYLLNQLKAAMGAATLKVSASTQDAAVGQVVDLSAIGQTPSGTSVAVASVTYKVVGTNASDALISGSQFVASVPGNYTVEGTSGSATGTVTIGVFGPATSLKITPPSTLVANGLQKASLTVSVLDANGNVVANNSDQITLTENSPAAATIYGNPTVTASGGVATFTLQAGQVAGAATTFTATDGTLSTTAQVTAEAQQATSVSVTPASPYLEANATNGTDVISAVVDDQTGEPMLSGVYTISFSASGAGNFSGSSTAAGVYYGPSQAPATATLDDIQGDTGSVTITASGSSLTSGSTAVQAVVAGAPAELAISTAQAAAANTPATYTVTAEDAHGYPVQWQGTVVLSSNPAGVTFSPSSLVFNNTSTASFTATGTTAGNYTITATAQGGGLTTATTSFTVQAGAVAKAVITPSSTSDAQYAPMGGSYTSWTYSVQLEDSAGNAVQQSGVEVDFTLVPTGGNKGTATLNGSSTATTTPVKAYTNGQGVATATVQAQSYIGDGYAVSATLPAYSGLGTIYGKSIMIEQLTTGAIGVTYTNPSNGSQVSQVQSGTTYDAALQLYGGQGNTLLLSSNDTLLVTESGAGTVNLSGSGVSPYGNSGTEWTINTIGGVAHFNVMPGKAGSVYLTYTDESVVTNPSSSTGLYVVAGTTVGGFGFMSNGQTITSGAPLEVGAGASVPITVTAQDAGGNAVAVASTTPVDVAPNLVSGFEIRSSSGGSDLASPYAIDIQAGQTSTTFYFVNDGLSPVSVYFTPTEHYAITNASPVTSTGPVTLSWTIKDDNGVALSGVSVQFTTANGSVSAQTGVTNASGQVSVTWNPPAGWTTNGTATVTLSVLGANNVTSDQVVNY